MPSLTCAPNSATRRNLSNFKSLLAGVSLCGWGLLGCNAASDHAPFLGAGDAGPNTPVPSAGACETPALGCDCATQGEVVRCGQVERISGQYVSCSMGQRSCGQDGRWGACVGDSISTLQLAPGQQRTRALGTGMTCPDNPCDPYCRIVIDSPADLPLPNGSGLTSDGGVQLLPTDEAVGAGSCTAMSVTPSPQALTITGLRGAALVAEYFVGVDRAAAQIPAAWVPTVKAPATSIALNSNLGDSGQAALPNYNYSIRWTGTVTAPATNAYTFCTSSDDGVRLWLDGNLLVNAWYDQGAEEHCTPPLAWVTGERHPLRYEFYQAYGGAVAELRWESPAIPKQIVPASAFIRPSALTVSGSGRFGVELTPPGCYPGTPHPAWSLDRLDLATIDGNGQVDLISGVAGPITATAYLGPLRAMGVINVSVDIKDDDDAPAGSVATFNAAAAGADPARLVYPYDQTVLPIGLRGPRLQWESNGAAASAVKVALRYPASGPALFSWSAIVAESSPPQAAVPSDVWKAFEQSAKGQAASWSLQRVVGGQARLPAARTVNFSTAPVRGKIYYTQYHRNVDANEMVVDPGSENPARLAFGSTDGCPVCHSLSANGAVFATSSRTGLSNDNYAAPLTFSSTLGGISSVNVDGTLSPIADFVTSPLRPNYTSGSVDWRGFAWAPLTPDGKFALVANNVWGNTREQLVGIDPTTRQVNIGSEFQSGGSGTGLLSTYYATTDASFALPVWKRLEPQVNFDFGLAAPGGAVPVDFSATRAGLVQGYFSETYRFELSTTSSDRFILSVGPASAGPFTGPGTLTLDVPLTAGSLAAFELKQQNPSGASNAQLFWSSPSTPRALIPQSQLFPPAAEPLHGANVVYDDLVTSSALIEPDIASDWALHGPAPAMAEDKWSSTWDALLEAPATGAIDLCIDADDSVTLSADGVQLIDSAVAYDGCVAAGTWTYGSKHALHIVHRDLTGAAHLILKYRYGGITEVVPTLNLTPLTPPAGARGLTATYYDLAAFNAALPATQQSPRAFQRIDANIDFDWGTGRPNYSTISDDDQFSARWTGRIILPCAGVYQFRSNGDVDDGGRLWIDERRVMAGWTSSAFSGASYFEPGTHDFKFDWHEATNAASARLQWLTPCPGSPGWVTIPSGSFSPSSPSTNSAGLVRDGGDNGNGSNYWIWQLPTSAAPAPVDVTASSAGAWGLAGSALMVPSFSPDGTKLVFIDGDSAGGAGWRKGLSTFDFDQPGKIFKNRRSVVNTWPLGDALKWPSFESDSRSVVFQATVPGDACCRKSDWTKYGYMGPTNYYEDPGRLLSVDSEAPSPTPVALSKLNSGERPKDANKSYQASMLPVAAGGYRWVVFTSTRPYGNTLNLPGSQQDFSDTQNYAAMTNYQDIQSQLWVAAIDDSPSGAADRSHPAFWLPSQNFAPSASSGYINERGTWVLDACHPAGTNLAASCEVDEDCCAGLGPNKTAACRLDAPISNPPTRHCQALPAAGQCLALDKACGATSDCCSGLLCLGAVCTPPPPVSSFSPQNYQRVYEADCLGGTKVVWRFFDWKTVTPDTGSKLEIFAETQADPALFATLPVAPTAVSADGVVRVATVTGAPVTNWTGFPVDPLLQAKDLKSQKFLKITVRFVPNDERNASPILKDWRQSYSCVPAE